MTLCEKILWQELRKNSKNGLYFRRQHPVSKFIVDFYCHELRLAVEVDGSIHDKEEQQERDLNRTAELENLGIKVLRIKNDDVLNNLRKVSAQITDEVKKRSEEITRQSIPSKPPTTP
jgi:very-short-patch-repair endonuclease